jgi:hypothetical protein
MDFLLAPIDFAESILPMEGPLAVPARAAIGAALGWLVIAAIRPEFAYDPVSQEPRPWSSMPELWDGKGAPTSTPWILGPVVGAILLAGFI